MSIYINALSAIRVGLEDYQKKEHERQLSAVRSLVSGILLLYKEKLYRIAPEENKNLLIKKQFTFQKNENGDIEISTKGGTINFDDIRSRFKELGIKTDFKKFERIQILRNNIEHFYTESNTGAIRDVIADSLTIISNFLRNELDTEPSEALGKNHWGIMLDTLNVYEHEKNLCQETMEDVDWPPHPGENLQNFIQCPACNSSLCRAETPGPHYQVDFRCTQCGTIFQFEEVAEECVDDMLAGEAHVAIKDGGESPYQTCDQCWKDTYLIEPNICANCSYSYAGKHCSRCEAFIPMEENDGSSLCSYCSHLMWKDD